MDRNEEMIRTFVVNIKHLVQALKRKNIVRILKLSNYVFAVLGIYLAYGNIFGAPIIHRNYFNEENKWMFRREKSKPS